MNVQRLKPAKIKWADVVFISAMIVQKDSLERVVELCKAHGKRVVVGPYVSTSKGQLPQADHIFVGEAETTLPEFVRDLARGTQNTFIIPQSGRRSMQRLSHISA